MKQSVKASLVMGIAGYIKRKREVESKRNTKFMFVMGAVVDGAIALADDPSLKLQRQHDAAEGL
jgi:hypothetical protein